MSWSDINIPRYCAGHTVSRDIQVLPRLFSVSALFTIGIETSRLQILDPVDQNGGHRYGDKREEDPADGYITQRKQKHGQVSKEIGAGQLPPGQVGDGKRQGVIPSAGTALTDDQSDSDSHEQPSRQSREQFPEIVEQGDAHG